jgi:hypothetical protein
VFDGADFEKYLHDRIKVDGKAGQLGESVKITRDGISVCSPAIVVETDSFVQVTPKLQ